MITFIQLCINYFNYKIYLKFFII